MSTNVKAEKFAEIEGAAYALLAERGYDATSMLSIAKASRTSNQTLYRWYGDKRGLFKAMVLSNAAQTRDILEQTLDTKGNATTCLQHAAPVLLGMLTGEKAIALNRAAAADHSGQLGAVIAEAGRDSIFPLFQALMQQGLDEGEFHNGDARQLATWLINLLIGDQQIRRVIGVLPPPTKAQVNRHAKTAINAFLQLASA
ncbi:MAG: TetR/AcrR family transcriptional regulator [Pseudomonadota bacterium]